MIAVLKHTTTDEQLKNLTEWLAIQGLGTHISRGNYQTVVGLIGDTRNIDIELLESLEMVESVQRVTDPSKNAASAFNPAERELIVGVVGLGLIGGSMASTFKLAGWTVLGADRDKTTLGYAKLADIITDELTDANIAKCDLLFVALYPQATINWLEKNAAKIDKKTMVIDLCGIKESVCEVGFQKAQEHGFTFVGGHPMAGTQFSGIKYSRSNLFRGAPMVLVPPVEDSALIETVKAMLAPAGFGQFSVTTAKDHDRMIAFTSQLAHVVSNAYIKSPTAARHGGFSAGSYKDMTRVAWLNEEMWTQLFLENGEALGFELDTIINALTQYRDAIADNDAPRLKALLRDGRIAKENIDGNGAERLKK